MRLGAAPQRVLRGDTDWIRCDLQREPIEAADAELHICEFDLQDFNPVEIAFARAKAMLRAVAARTRADLWRGRAFWAVKTVSWAAIARICVCTDPTS